MAQNDIALKQKKKQQSILHYRTYKLLGSIMSLFKRILKVRIEKKDTKCSKIINKNSAFRQDFYDHSSSQSKHNKYRTIKILPTKKH